MLQLFCKDYDFNNLFLLYFIFTGEALPHLPPLTAHRWYNASDSFLRVIKKDGDIKK